MPAKLSYWQVHTIFFDELARGVLGYGINVHDVDCYPWDDYLTDTLVLMYA